MKYSVLVRRVVGPRGATVASRYSRAYDAAQASIAAVTCNCGLCRKRDNYVLSAPEAHVTIDRNNEPTPGG